MAERIVQEESLTTVADAIRAKGGTTDALSFPDGFKTAIEAIQTGGGGGGGVTSAHMKDVNFYDYDGTRLYSYTLAEAQALTQLPALPSQPGLICQGWNWTLEDIKAMGRAVDVCAMYITDDGKTRLHITVAMEGRMDVPIRFKQTVANSVTIDWGDGSAAETISGTGTKTTSHTYASAGNYVISLDVAEGGTLELGSASSSYCVLGTNDNSGRVYNNMLKKVEIGRGVTSIGSYAFNKCGSLETVMIPNSVTTLSERVFMNCTAMTSVVIPNSVTKIDTYAFSYDSSLTRVIIPSSVTIIDANAFNGCYGMALCSFANHKAVPTLSNSNAFSSAPGDLKILVPAALYDEWIAASNWSTYARRIVGV